MDWRLARHVGHAQGGQHQHLGHHLRAQRHSPGAVDHAGQLVGYWSQTSRSYTIRADATYDWLSLYINYGSCITTDRMEVTQTGHLAVQGTSLTFTPTASTLKTTDCSGNVTTTHSVGATRTFTWRVGAGTSAATSLYLTDPTANPPSTDEFPKQ